ncbi:hypothetical protein [Lacrimispora saccharolytica]|uniref:Uncharacterized protein n=1 Tax=Lacrimispora saccharolytica (strain ATCC 35040 / DSM 2544 / NRCC 2533 / WM1) TaxID=610130 RepID=D9R0I9_LACSW|nr:hypothetical protein [Lacrimispora saccharolytica]ADL06422.1 conserved hypothetical protein [[Clostridium] saccharolyticum WM1]QRV19488.1 hypothetical protein I6K70_18925 [Lacrimispora saccharolytica]
MNNTVTGKRGSITKVGSILHIENALVEDIYTPNSRTGYILISYASPGRKDMVFIELLQLNVGWETILINQFGDPITLCNVRKGMWINAEFSAAMTRSIPPQSKAYRIVAIMQKPLFRITTDRIASVDAENGFLTSGNANNELDQMRFVVSQATEILDQTGSSIPLSALQPGQMARIEHANFQTASIPPQTTAYRMQVI